jgi:hypothetical protein
MNKIADQAILDSVVAGLPYKMCKELLVKPLPVTMVKREMIVPVETGEHDADTGANEYDTKKEIREVESSLREGIILAVPDVAKNDFKIGEHIIFPMKYAYPFDLFKDSLLVKVHDVLAYVQVVNNDINVTEITVNDGTKDNNRQ